MAYCHAELLVGGSLATVRVAGGDEDGASTGRVGMGSCLSACVSFGDRVWGAHHTVCVPDMHDKLPLCECEP